MIIQKNSPLLLSLALSAGLVLNGTTQAAEESHSNNASREQQENISRSLLEVLFRSAIAGGTASITCDTLCTLLQAIHPNGAAALLGDDETALQKVKRRLKNINDVCDPIGRIFGAALEEGSKSIEYALTANKVAELLSELREEKGADAKLLSRDDSKKKALNLAEDLLTKVVRKLGTKHLTKSLKQGKCRATRQFVGFAERILVESLLKSGNVWLTDKYAGGDMNNLWTDVRDYVTPHVLRTALFEWVGYLLWKELLEESEQAAFPSLG